jgi:hypothetical protein
MSYQELGFFEGKDRQSRGGSGGWGGFDSGGRISYWWAGWKTGNQEFDPGIPYSVNGELQGYVSRSHASEFIVGLAFGLALENEFRNRQERQQEIDNSIAGSGLAYTRDPSEVFYGELAQADGGAMSPSNISCLNDCPITTGVDLLNMDSKSIYLSINMWVVFDSKTDTKDFSTNFLSDEYERTILTIHFEARFEPNGAQMFRTGRGFDANRNYFRYEYFDGNGYRDVYGSIPSTKPNYPGAKYWWNDL